MGAGDASAREALFDRVYEELRRLAQGHVGRAGAGHSLLQPTALVHEAYLRLIKVEDPSFESRRAFFALASRCMRSVLVNHARARHAQKRGGPGADLAIDTQTPVPDVADHAIDLLDLSLALEELEQIDPVLAQAIELRHLAGQSVQEVAEIMSSSQRSTERRLRVAHSWLRDRFDVA